MSGYELNSFYSKVSLHFIPKYHCKSGSVYYFVLSLRKEHIRSCIVVVSEREYKDSHALRPLSKDLREI